MIAAEITTNEFDRLSKLLNYQILDSAFEKDYDEIAQLASQICETPISLISIVDNVRQWFKAKVGLEVRETHRDLAFCAHVILQEDIFEIEDTAKDHRFFDNPLVTSDPAIRFYAGMPLTTPDGFNLGTLCVIGQEPKKLTEPQKFALKILAKQVITLLELRLNLILLNNNISELQTKNAEILEKQAKIQAQADQLQETNRVKDKLFSLIAHDLRSPLNSLQSVFFLVENDALSPEELRNLMFKIKTEVITVDEMMVNLLFWAKSQLSSIKTNMQEFDIEKTMFETLNLLQKPAELKVIRLVFNKTADDLITADENQIRIIIRNLVANAIKFTPDNGIIEVNFDSLDDNWLIEVKDTGIGMSKEDIAKLFHINTHFTRQGTANEKGSGLGLLLCKEFVENHHGKIWVNSKIYEGTSFFVSLPKKQILDK